MQYITWDDCQQFIGRLNEMTGLHFRLPTEAEWKYAARGGKLSHGYKYAGSDDIKEVGWYNENTNGLCPMPVALLRPNELGVYDMTGNVWEWGEKTTTGSHPYMGGSCFFPADKCFISSLGYSSNYEMNGASVGFRLVLDVHEYVDLGLSVMWATCNVGASAPEKYGDYFAWGEVETKDSYTWANYKWCDGTDQNMTKYNAEDGLTTLLPDDDAAHVNWGGPWRMLTGEEFRELKNKCTWELTTHNGTQGYKVTGPNGNSIFLPVAGYISETPLDYDGYNGYYRSSTIGLSGLNYSRYFFMTSSYITIYDGYRRSGFTIRPVLTND